VAFYKSADLVPALSTLQSVHWDF